MLQLTIRDVRASGLSLAELARLSGTNYGRLWRFTVGNLVNGLDADEAERVARVLAEARAVAV